MPQEKKMPNQNELDQIIRQAAQQLGADPKNLQNATQQGSVEKLLQSLRPQDAQALQQVLANKEQTAKVLNSPQAQALMKKLFEGK